MVTAPLAERHPWQRRSALCRAFAALLLGWALVLLTASGAPAQTPGRLPGLICSPQPKLTLRPPLAS